MNKNELIDAVAGESGESKAAVARVLDAIVSQVQTAVTKGDKVTLVGFGSFYRAERAAKTGRNPKTGASIQIPASAAPKFSAGASFKSRVNSK